MTKSITVAEIIERMNKIIDDVARMEEITQRNINATQARIDELMLEYCPDEVTDEQWDEYSKHQVFVEMDWKWKDLTEEEVDTVIDKTYGASVEPEVTWVRHNFATEIVKAFKEKNK